jgi:hypothetical protein
VVATEDLRELSGLPVAHGAGHRLDRKRAVGEQLGGSSHADPLELPAEGRSTHLRESPLKLPAARGDLARHACERQIRVPVHADDHLEGLAVKVPAPLDGGCPH